MTQPYQPHSIQNLFIQVTGSLNIRDLHVFFFIIVDRFTAKKVVFVI
jgi:hypothetical protein